MATNLTKKEKGFIKDYVQTGNGVQSALNNYDTDDYSTAGAIASENLKKPKIKNAISEAIPDELLTEKHLALLNKMDKKFDTEGNLVSEDIDVQAVSKGLDMGYKIKGSYAPEKKELSGNVETKSDLDLDLLAEAMAEKLKEEKI